MWARWCAMGLASSDFWTVTPGMYSAIMAERGRALREQSIAAAFDTARIKADAMSGKAKSLGEYLDELMSDEERLEKSERAFAAHFDAMIARDEARRARGEGNA